MIARIRNPLPLAALAASLLWLALVPAAAAHGGVEVGPYVLTIGWRTEPAFVGQPNGVQVLVTDHDSGAPVNRGVNLAVVVEAAGEQSDSLALGPAFSVEDDVGTPGDYGAVLVPTAPGDYTFHVTGTIVDTDVDVELASGEETFATVQGSSDAEFPVKLPNLGEVATRLDRIDDRIAALASAGPGRDVADAVEAADAATDAARAATSAANQALLVGAGLGIAGVVIGLIGVVLALRGGRRGSTPA